MARSVVFGNTRRCEHCRFVPRWCICDGFRAVPSPVQIEVLIHHREYSRPTSTGRLIERVIPGARTQIFRPGTLPTLAGFVDLTRPVWILHPNGEALPDGAPPGDLQVVLIDGSWREANRMMPVVQSWGRRVSLPMSGESRYWLRGQQRSGNFSTVEALLFFFAALGWRDSHDQLQLQFELHVYAGLRTRGDKAAAEAYLATSPIREAFPELLRNLAEKRPLT